MKNESNRGATGGIGFCGLLAIVFVVLKLCKVITWSWLWVLAPVWIPAAIAVLILVIYVLVSLGLAIFRRK